MPPAFGDHAGSLTPQGEHPFAGSRPATPSLCPRAALNLPCQWCRVLLTSSHGTVKKTLDPIDPEAPKRRTYDDILKAHNITPSDDNDLDESSQLAERDLNLEDRPNSVASQRRSKYEDVLKRHGIDSTSSTPRESKKEEAEVLVVNHDDDSDDDDEPPLQSEGAEGGPQWEREVRLLQQASKGVPDEDPHEDDLPCPPISPPQRVNGSASAMRSRLLRAKQARDSKPGG